MSNNIVPTTETNIPGVELIYLEDLDVAGIHIRGLARLLDCDMSLVRRLLEGEAFKHILEAQIQTPGGIQGAVFILEEGVVEVLEKIQDSARIKQETRDAARNLYRQFAKAGFKLYTMLHVAPHKLKQKVDDFVIPKTYAEALLEAGRLAQELELTQLKLEAAKPAIEFAEAIAVSDESIDFNEFAKIIGTGRTRLFRMMRKAGVILQQSNLPYQKWIDAGYFEATEIVGANGVNVYAMVTGKGQLWLQQKLAPYFSRREENQEHQTELPI
jgi:phage antirepressor YoqD-like protein